MNRPWLVLLLCASGWLSACSWLIDPENQPTRCALVGDAGTDPCGAGFVCSKAGTCTPKCVLIDGEPDPCGAGRECREGQCVAPCKPNKVGEICSDGIDNNCNGMIDEVDPEGKDACGDKVDNDCDLKIDEGHDQDLDLNDWCGDPNKQGGGGIGDCDDRNPTVFYKAPELCDGLDNDCDNITDETTGKASLCPAGQECVGQRCVVPSCAIPGSSAECSATEMCNVETGKCGPKGCSEATCNGPGEYCDQVSGECRTERRKNGESCAAHSDCKSLSCIESAALRLKVPSARVCGQTCCYDDECGTGERCFVSGTGARSCLPVADVAPDNAAAQLCTLDEQCSASQACAVVGGQPVSGSIATERENLTTSVCRTTRSSERDVGDDCANPFFGYPDSALCESLVCISTSNGALPRCSQACSTSADCAALSDAIGGDGYCRFAATSQSNPDYVPICVIAGNEVGSGKPGESCTSPRSCEEGGCVGASVESDGRCAATCCNDSQCGKWGELPTLCRPVAFGTGRYETRCVP